MYVKEIKWIDEENKEAIVEISDSKNVINCYAYSLKYNIGEIINENLEALEIKDVISVDIIEEEKVIMDGLSCNVIGVLCCDKSVLKIGDLLINIQKENIPKDINDETKVSARITRVDLW